MKKLVVVLAAFLFIMPNVANAGAVAQRAAATLTNRVMSTLEPQIAELADKAPIPSDAKDELRRQLTEAASRIVNQEIQGAMGGRLPNPAALANQVLGELRTITENIVRGILDGSLAGSGGGGSAVIMSSTGRADAQATAQVAPLPLEERPFLAVYVSGHSDPTVNKFLAADVTRALVRTERYREAARYEEFLSAINAEQQRRTISENRIVEIAKNHGAEQIGILSMTSILGTYVITAKILDVENSETIANGELDNSLASLADIRAASEGLVGIMVRAEQRHATVADVVAPPSASAAANIQDGRLVDSRDGQTYRVVEMPDGKTWMAENLNYNPEGGGSWCYRNRESNCETYGRFYNWNTAVDVCPEGWRLPSDADWETLIETVGSNAGTKLKSNTDWRTNRRTPVGTDNYGFSALPGGMRFGSGRFNNIGLAGYWWTTTERGEHSARGYDMFNRDVGVSSRWYHRSEGLSVRCVVE